MLGEQRHSRLERIGSSFLHGLAQIASGGAARRKMPARAKTVAEALRADWVALGSDFDNAIYKVKPLGQAGKK